MQSNHLNDPNALRDYLIDNIPVVAGMEIEVSRLGHREVELRAPLEPNTNHRGTAFGGSISTLAILAGWAWLHLELERAGLPHRLVIHRSEVDYLAPVRDAFTARAEAPSPERIEAFLGAFQQKGKARIEVPVVVRSRDVVVARYSGSYAALSKD